MDNSLLNKVKDIKLVTKQSKAGNTYQMLQSMFTNGYALETFVKDEQLFIINNIKYSTLTPSRTSALGRG